MTSEACDDCLRRTWVLTQFAGYMQHARHSASDLVATLSMPDMSLLGVAERRGKLAVELECAYARFDARPLRAACRRAGVTAVCAHAGRYPAPLAGLPAAPPVLYCSGDPTRLDELLAAPAAAVVGTRRASPYALEVAQALGHGLSSAGVTVVSGMAYGVDSAAHAGAVEAGAATIAVLAGSPDIATPAGKRALHRQLIARAAVVSEWPPGFKPRPWCFTARNRIIAGLAAATIVVEAGDHSGSLTTARFAEASSRPVGAVPGRVTSAGAAGSNALLYDGAHVVRDARDALQLACGVSPSPVATQLELPSLSPRRPALSRRQRLLLAAIEEGDGANAALQEGAEDTLAELAELELLGLIRRGPGGRYVRTLTSV
jgi:DNA processing protein